MLVARTAGLEWPDRDKSSVPASLSVRVTPVNDAIPKLVNNTGLSLWAGSSRPITNTELGAVDSDSTAEEGGGSDKQPLVFTHLQVKIKYEK